MNEQFWGNLGLTEQEINSLEFVNDAANVSMDTYVASGTELKQIDKLAANEAQSEDFKSAWNKIHQAERQVQVNEVDY